MASPQCLHSRSIPSQLPPVSQQSKALLCDLECRRLSSRHASASHKPQVPARQSSSYLKPQQSRPPQVAGANISITKSVLPAAELSEPLIEYKVSLMLLQ